MKKDKWKLWNLQFVIVANNLNYTATDISQKLKELFDSNVMILPIPDDAPKEIPRFSASSNDNFRIEISKERINLFFENPKDSRKSIENSKEELKEKIEKILEQLKVDISWIGLILRSININEDANNNIKELIEGKAQNIFELNDEDSDLLFKYHKKIKDLEINNKNYNGDLNMDLGSNIRDDVSGKQVGNLLVLDMNTRYSAGQIHDDAIIKLFIDKVFSKQEGIFTQLEFRDEK